MKRFKQLRIFGVDNSAKLFLEALKKKKSQVFEYNRPLTEDYAKNIFRDISDVGCFKSSRVSLFQSCVWILFDKDHLYVANITSEINSSLSKDEYNLVLDAFLKEFVQPSMEGDFHNLGVNLTPGILTMEDLVSADSYDKMNKWQASYDKYYMEEDFLTYNFWIKAIVALVRNKDEIDYDDLREWLIDDCGWPEAFEDKIHEHYLNYELGRDILSEWTNENEE